MRRENEKRDEIMRMMFHFPLGFILAVNRESTNSRILTSIIKSQGIEKKIEEIYDWSKASNARLSIEWLCTFLVDRCVC